MKERVSPRKDRGCVVSLGLTEHAAITAIGYHEASIESIRTHGRLNELSPKTE